MKVIDFVIGFLIVLALAMASSDGPHFPFINLGGIVIFAACSRVIQREHGRTS